MLFISIILEFFFIYLFIIQIPLLRVLSCLLSEMFSLFYHVLFLANKLHLLPITVQSQKQRDGRHLKAPIYLFKSTASAAKTRQSVIRGSISLSFLCSLCRPIGPSLSF